jgi:hypothetical protein
MIPTSSTQAIPFHSIEQCHGSNVTRTPSLTSLLWVSSRIGIGWPVSLHRWLPLPLWSWQPWWRAKSGSGPARLAEQAEQIKTIDFSHLRVWKYADQFGKESNS